MFLTVGIVMIALGFRYPIPKADVIEPAPEDAIEIVDKMDAT